MKAVEGKEKRRFDLWAALFILVALFCAASRLKITDWNDHLYQIRYLVIIGVILGMALGYSRFSAQTCRWISIAYSLVIITWQLILAANQQGEVLGRLLSLADSLMAAFFEFLSNHPVQDPILFFTIITLVYWIISLSAGYQLTRHGNPGIPLLACSIVVVALEYYHSYLPGSSFYTILFIFCTVILVGRLYYLNARREWEKGRIKADTEIGFDLGRTTLIVSLILILVSWNLPQVASAFAPGGSWYDKMGNSWNSISDYISNLAASLSNAPRITIYIYGNTIPLGRGAALGNETVFTVQVIGKSPIRGRFYWQARNYDTYIHGLWTTTRTDSQNIMPEQGSLPNPDVKMGRQTVTLLFTPRIPFSAIVYYPTYPLSISRPIKVTLAYNQDGSIDITGLMLLKPLRGGEVYQVKALVSAPTADQLMTADNNYPEWVQDRYLQVPNDLPKRITELAQQITASKTNQYERVVAITSYLRENIKYQEIISESPANRDPIDWFLFDYKAGFCNYYASAEVIMLRSIGIPARLAVGYAEGETEEGRNLFTIHERDSHAWPEVYFSGIGWVEFEPTVSQPALIYPIDVKPSGISTDLVPTPTPPAPTPTPTPANNNPSLGQRLVTSPWLWLGLLAEITIPILILWQRRRKYLPKRASIPLRLVKVIEKRGVKSPVWLKNWASYTRLSPVERLFTTINLILYLIGYKPNTIQTPAEKVDSLVHLIPETSIPASVLLEEYQKAVYSSHPTDFMRAKKASNQLKSLGFRSFLLHFLIVDKTNNG